MNGVLQNGIIKSWFNLGCMGFHEKESLVIGSTVEYMGFFKMGSLEANSAIWWLGFFERES